MRRATLRGLQRHAPAVLGTAGTSDNVDVLTRTLDAPEPLVREHATRAPGRLGA